MFLIEDDYYQVVSEQDFIDLFATEKARLKLEKSAQEFISMYIRQRYDVTKVFKEFSDWSLSNTYAIDDFFVYTETAFSATSTYVLSDRVSYDGNIYSAKGAIPSGTFNAADWTLICEDNLIYTCIAASTGNYPENTTYFTQSDPRNKQIVLVMVDVVLYNANAQIIPNNIPELRRIRYNSNGTLRKGDGSAVGTLMAIQQGDIMIDLPIYADDQEGQIITYGSNLKRNSSY